MFDVDNRCVTSGNYHTLTIATPVARPVDDYNALRNKPSFNSIVLVGDINILDILAQAGLPDLLSVPTAPLTSSQLDDIIGE